MTFLEVLKDIKEHSFTQSYKGTRFEQLVANWFLSDPVYAPQVSRVWMWNDFPARKDFGTGHDVGVDLVILTSDGEYWSVQCKCYQDSSTITQPMVANFIATSAIEFSDPQDITIRHRFTKKLWVASGGRFNPQAKAFFQKTDIRYIGFQQLMSSQVDWEQIYKGKSGAEARTLRKNPMKHQSMAIEKAREYFKTRNRGKLIMACGTGKTFTSLRLVEDQLSNKGLVLFLVPSISLLGQSLNAWFADSEKEMRAVCICSDASASKKTYKDDDEEGDSVRDLAYPASTNAESAKDQLLSFRDHDGLVVVFSTYQSIEVVRRTQQLLLDETKSGYGEFDFIICDEAHRTAIVQTDKDIRDNGLSPFARIHDANYILGKKRLYMTATPKLMGTNVKMKNDVTYFSMDDQEKFGDIIHKVNFAYAVTNNLLTDYKVFIITVSESEVPAEVRKKVEDNDEKAIDYSTAQKLVGMMRGLSKIMVSEDKLQYEIDPRRMRRAMAFCQKIGDIDVPESSKNIAHLLPELSKAYIQELSDNNDPDLDRIVEVDARHVDGSMNSLERQEKIEWLREDTDNDRECRVITNVRCLSEGVDVPALDAVLFLSPKNSPIEVVQTIGRVMRTFKKGTADEKKFGYILIPVVLPAGMTPEQALDDNKAYKHVWDILQALRAHDDNFEAIINTIPSSKIVIDRPRGNGCKYHKACKTKPAYPDCNYAVCPHYLNEPTPDGGNTTASEPTLFEDDDLRQKFYAKLVDKCGDRGYWGKWGESVGKTCKAFKARILRLIDEKEEVRDAFNEFVSILKCEINDSVDSIQTVEMIAQHLIMKPVFDAIFSDYNFATNNPISRGMEKMVEVFFVDHGFKKDVDQLEEFYEEVRSTCRSLDSLDSKQTIIKNLYERFFKGAFPEAVEELGIVYTPVQCVNFMIRSVNQILKSEFDTQLYDRGVKIIDPFTGTGTFVAQMLKYFSTVTDKDTLSYKYQHDIYCNEIVLLAYYIADVNIETVFNSILESKEYLPYNGISLADTFNIVRDSDKSKISGLEQKYFDGNKIKLLEQTDNNLTVIIGNPPYSVAKGVRHSEVEKSLDATYVKHTKATLKNSVYDSYIQAFRWASDRIVGNPKGGVVAFISNGGWLDGNAQDGMRKCLRDEFTDIYVFNLRGNQRTSGELSRKEGGKIFGGGCRAPIAITFLVRNPNKKSPATIHYKDIGDYLTQKQKLEIIDKATTMSKIDWQIIEPNEKEDWINQRDGVFDNLIILGDKKDKTANCVFASEYSCGVKTNRDVWNYNFSASDLEKNQKRQIDFYNSEVDRYIELGDKSIDVAKFVIKDDTKFHWDRPQIQTDIPKGTKYSFDKNKLRVAVYRPFVKINNYFAKELTNCQYQIPQLFPTPEQKNLVIGVNGIGSTKDFMPLITDCIPDLEYVSKSQCFPLYYYKEIKSENQMGTLFDDPDKVEYVRKDGISDWMLRQVKERYHVSPQSTAINKEMIFYYVYGLLHSRDYRTRFADDLKKSLPRIPIVERVEDFKAFYEAGKKLADLHVNYESVAPCHLLEVECPDTNDYADFAVYDKMRFGKSGKQDDKTTIILNDKVRIKNIPLRAYEYVVNGKSALEWVMERYQVKTDKDTHILNDCNAWALEHHKPRYILDLILSLVNVSLQTLEVIDGLPGLEFGGGK